MLIKRKFVAVFFVCLLSFSFVLGLKGFCAVPDEDVASTQTIYFTNADLDFVPNDASNANGYRVIVNVTNVSFTLTPPAFPIYWKLEWEVFRSDGSRYNKGVESGVFHKTVASNSVEICQYALKYGSFRCRLITETSSGIKKTSDWKTITVGENGGGGGDHRSYSPLI